VVIEAFLAGEEASFFAFIDGETCVALASAQDHKAVGEGDTGTDLWCIIAAFTCAAALPNE
jgi:phosphoribosylamine-glycine ligase